VCEVCGHSQTSTGVKQQAARSAKDRLVIGMCVISTLYNDIGLIFCLLFKSKYNRDQSLCLYQNSLMALKIVFFPNCRDAS